MADAPKPPQLRMRHALKSAPPRILVSADRTHSFSSASPASARGVVIPGGYLLREGTRADEAALAKLLSIAFKETWSGQRVCAALFDDKSVDRTFIIEHAGEVVATASHQARSEPNPKAGWVHWVASNPEHSGKKLGVIATLAVLHESVRQQRPEVYLQTDDFRLPAIASYISCGFEPDPWHESHPGRWAAVRADLARKRG